MTGWKTKAGIITGAVGVALLAGSQVSPNPDMAVWLKFLGTLIAAGGGSLGVYGVAHKVEKAGKTEKTDAVPKVD